MTKGSPRTFLPRYAAGWSMPQNNDLDKAPHEESADPRGNRAERRRAKKLGIRKAES